ncbi:phage holin family protein [Perlucidibaca piscinae]|uniref:phage holin family protein n=1 Tax=Perlucidibaca piscinae TaxID=392589 RepID=UPI0003B398DF|nr:phage holin family protein [Perlucidibaca piscinae]
MMTFLMSTLPGLVTAMAYMITAIRLLCFPRNGARYRPLISLLASLTIAVLMSSAIVILLFHPVVGVDEALIALLLCVLVCRAGGNLAALLRPST